MAKNVLITGSSAGIGLEIGNILEKAGYKVFGCGRRKILSPFYFSCDLSNLKNVEILYKKAKEALGGIDILINNAGEYIYSPVEKMTHEGLNRLFNLNFLSHYMLVSCAVPYMKKNKWGRIVNISSISGVLGEGHASAYAASKSAYYGFSKSLALELSEFNITVNSISPGWVDTDLTNNALNPDEKKETLDVIPQKRFVEPEEVANLVKYLVSNEAKGITGQNINICAGLTCGC